MVVVTGREFRASQAKYLTAASQGEDVILKSRRGTFRIVPVTPDDTVYNDRQLNAMLARAFEQAQQGKVIAKEPGESSEEFINRMLCTE